MINANNNHIESSGLRKEETSESEYLVAFGSCELYFPPLEGKKTEKIKERQFGIATKYFRIRMTRDALILELVSFSSIFNSPMKYAYDETVLFLSMHYRTVRY